MDLQKKRFDDHRLWLCARQRKALYAHAVFTAAADRVQQGMGAPVWEGRTLDTVPIPQKQIFKRTT